VNDHGTGKRFIFSKNVQPGSRAHPTSYTTGATVHSPGEDDHSTQL